MNKIRSNFIDIKLYLIPGVQFKLLITIHVLWQ